MKSRLKMIWGVLLLSGISVPGWGSFSSQGLVTISAGVTISSGTGVAPAANFVITASTLPSQAFFGKNMIVPLQITNTTGAINATTLRVFIVYQLLDPSGSPTTAPTSVPVDFEIESQNTSTVQGAAIVPRSSLGNVQNGGSISYVFEAQSGGANVILGAGGLNTLPIGSTLNSPFQTTINNQLCQPISPSGSRVSAPDLSVGDGKTAVTFPQNVVTAAGQLCMQWEDPATWPLGPNGLKPVAVYTMTLVDTTLAGVAQLVLSYPSDSSGKVLDSQSNPNSLGIYWLDDTSLSHTNGIWQPLSEATLDSTLHTVTGMTSHFSTFALFTAGALGAADLRPRERIITPNGDGINDTASFSGLASGEQVHLFDVRGRRVRTLQGPSPVWDGKDDDGKIVPSGVYIYQYTSGGQRVSGVIGVAR